MTNKLVLTAIAILLSLRYLVPWIAYHITRAVALGWCGGIYTHYCLTRKYDGSEKIEKQFTQQGEASRGAPERPPTV